MRAVPLRRAAQTYRVGLGLAFAGAAVALGALAAMLAVLSVRPAAGHTVELLGRRLLVPAANAQAIVLLALATLGVAVVLATLRGALLVVRSNRRLRRALPVAGALEREQRTFVVHGERPQAFTAGLLRPSVYVTTAALDQLSGEELGAVLAHERLHRLRRDPLRIAAARVLGEALFFLPVLRGLAERYCALAELAADDHALRAAGGDRAPLAGALLAFADTGIAPERVDQLAGQLPDWQLPVAMSVVSLAGAGALGLLVWQLARHAILQTNLGLPLLSSQPCVVLLAAMPLAAIALGRWATRRF